VEDKLRSLGEEMEQIEFEKSTGELNQGRAWRWRFIEALLTFTVRKDFQKG
jgi:hypothetical protein